jgi:dTDP-4-dehydrorhamnose 3,5-epimerase
MIAGVAVIPLRQIGDARGKVMHMLRSTDPHFEQFGEIYFSTASPGVVKGWHEHTRQTQFYAVIQGNIRLALFDNRPDSPSYAELQLEEIGAARYCLVRIPPHVIYSFRALGTETAIVANCPTLPHDPAEAIRHPLTGSPVPYIWEDAAP